MGQDIKQNGKQGKHSDNNPDVVFGSIGDRSVEAPVRRNLFWESGIDNRHSGQDSDNNEIVDNP